MPEADRNLVFITLSENTEEYSSQGYLMDNKLNAVNSILLSSLPQWDMCVHFKGIFWATDCYEIMIGEDVVRFTIVDASHL